MNVFLYFELGCVDEDGAKDPSNGWYYKCQRGRYNLCTEDWFKTKCKKFCGVCGQGKYCIKLR